MKEPGLKAIAIADSGTHITYNHPEVARKCNIYPGMAVTRRWLDPGSSSRRRSGSRFQGPGCRAYYWNEDPVWVLYSSPYAENHNKPKKELHWRLRGTKTLMMGCNEITA